MSPEESENDSHSSRKSSTNSVMDQQACHSPKLEVRDVQVDCQATVVRGSKRHSAKLTKKDSLHSTDSRENSAEAQVTCWDIEESTLDNSKYVCINTKHYIFLKLNVIWNMIPVECNVNGFSSQFIRKFMFTLTSKWVLISVYIGANGYLNSPFGSLTWGCSRTIS